ncbi:HDOD domain-containing protein [Thioalkalivibrio thiocyanodenitrificans]|uniref:HDOD domain-containing protein n=1 Tax=Thioalkalivibrio thiocyanodenitrificans TaxID=243063 RepID=UPI0003A0BF33|nr:HDOD domain-containing protein [Thioalkalivibrio thiocyanodenitrificans]
MRLENKASARNGVDPVEEGVAYVYDALLGVDEPRLPVMPQSARRIQAALLRGGALDTRKVSGLLSADPGLSARLLRLANSPLFSDMGTARTPRQAIALVGEVLIQRMLCYAATDSLYHASSPTTAPWFNCVLEHSQWVARTAYALATLAGWERTRCVEAFVAGSLHDIGALVALQILEQRPDLASDKKIVAEIVMQTHCKAGALLAEAWHLPEPYREVIEHHEQPIRLAADASEALSLLEVVQCADLFHGRCPAVHSHAALKRTRCKTRLGLPPDWELEKDPAFQGAFAQAHALL